MAQKDKIKELVGRGLNSYHTKSLQQIDRIEKKNKEQNHKISILSNELDNDYLTKTEEGSVVSLEHSKEGMVYLDELQGNTLVNYCTDGSKEMTLNGDIDVEGVSVTTTESVDNGKVDVMCEGNTLVNLYKWKTLVNNGDKIVRYNNGLKFTVTETSSTHLFQGFEKPIYKDNTDYTFIINITKNTFPSSVTQLFRIFRPESTNGTGAWIGGGVTGLIKVKITTKSTASDWNGSSTNFGFTQREIGELIIEDMILLEGDWTNKEVPNFFEGMKSVGQDDTNGHKIEILSQNKNLITELQNISENRIGISSSFNNNILTINGVATNNGDFDYQKLDTEIFLKKNTDYTLKYHIVGGDSTRKTFAYKINKLDGTSEWKTAPSGVVTFNSGADIYSISRIRFYVNVGETYNNLQLKVQLEEGNIASEHIQGKLNKKEILLNEPLRGLPNGIKDKKVKICNKWYIERNCGEVTITEDALTTKSWGDDGNKRYVYVSGALPNMKTNSYIYTDKIPTANNFYNSNYFGVSSTSVLIFCFPTEIQTREEKKELVKPYLQNGGLKVTYQLNTPTYEPLETEPTLNTYNDVTHISNNSIIPCNMKIKNSGYNAIIKPSTLYTIALDTNKSGTVGMNLGGVKGTTTNNVLKLTTPATLTDDSLRIYGKGIKGSKVRLLEGDKTNWIPSHFEGMKSSFEDKVQEDGSYKMEILCNNKNLFDINEIINKIDSRGYELNGNSIILKNTHCCNTRLFENKFKRNTRYIFSYDYSNSSKTNFFIQVFYTDGTVEGFYTQNVGKLQRATSPNKTVKYISFSYGNVGDTILSNIQIEEGVVVTDYKPNNQNKIQFSSIEPLRSLPNGVKDKFVFKDGKLMIERNCKTERVDSNTMYSIARYNDGNNDTEKTMLFSLQKVNSDRKHGDNNYVCNIIPRVNSLTNGGYTIIQNNYESIWLHNLEVYSMYYYIRINKSRLNTLDIEGFVKWLSENLVKVVYELVEPTYEEIPYELSKIILEGYENGTLFIDTNIPPTSTVTYAGETPIVKSVKLNKTEVLNNTNDINSNIIPYLMDMDYRVVCLQLQSEEFNGGVAMARLFGGTYEMLQRDIQSKRYSIDEYKHRLDAYLDANKITEEEYNKLGDMLNE